MAESHARVTDRSKPVNIPQRPPPLKNRDYSFSGSSQCECVKLQLTVSIFNSDSPICLFSCLFSRGKSTSSPHNNESGETKTGRAGETNRGGGEAGGGVCLFCTPLPRDWARGRGGGAHKSSGQTNGRIPNSKGECGKADSAPIPRAQTKTERRDHIPGQRREWRGGFPVGSEQHCNSVSAQPPHGHRKSSSHTLAWLGRGR